MFKVDTESSFYLYHKKTQTLIEKLNWTQFHSLCRSFGKEGASQYYLWSTQDDKWVRLEPVVDEILENEGGLLRYPPKPPSDISGEVIEHQLVEKPSDSREYKRHRRMLNMTLDCSGHLMKLQTYDISLGGIKFKEPIDLKSRTKYVFLYYSFGSEVLEFKAQPLYRDESQVFDTVTITSCNNLQLWKKAVEWSPNSKAS